MHNSYNMPEKYDYKFAINHIMYCMLISFDLPVTQFREPIYSIQPFEAFYMNLIISYTVFHFHAT